MEHSLWQFFVDHRPSILVDIAKLFSVVGDDAVLLPLTVLLAVYGFMTKKRTLALLGPALAMVPTFIAVGAIKVLVNRSRPPVTSALVDVTSASMPSGHAAYAATLAATAWILVASSTRRVLFRWTAVVVAAVAGVSRMVLGVHWLSDVLVGWAVGATVGFCVVTALGKRLQSTE